MASFVNLSRAIEYDRYVHIRMRHTPPTILIPTASTAIYLINACAILHPLINPTTYT